MKKIFEKIKKINKTMLLTLFLMIYGVSVSAQSFEDGVVDFLNNRDDLAFETWLPLAVSGDKRAQNNVGYFYKKGISVEQDDIEAIRWLRKASSQGSVKAKNNIGSIYHLGFDTVGRNDDEAMKWYKLAANDGSTHAAYTVGEIYEDKSDFVEAFNWYKKAAEAGNQHAQLSLGKMLENRVNDKYAALNWYSKSAEQGNIEAERLMNILILGEEETIKKYTEEAKYGTSMEIYRLAELYESFDDSIFRDFSTPNNKIALSLYKKAADMGLEMAKAKMNIAFFLSGGEFGESMQHDFSVKNRDDDYFYYE